MGAVLIVTIPLLLCSFVLLQVSRWNVLWAILAFSISMLYYEATRSASVSELQREGFLADAGLSSTLGLDTRNDLL